MKKRFRIEVYSEDGLRQWATIEDFYTIEEARLSFQERRNSLYNWEAIRLIEEHDIG